MAKLILITGVSGFVATHIVKSFLERGYHVRGTVRSEESAKNVRTTFSQYGDQLSFVTVPNIDVSGAFDDAVLGVDGVSAMTRGGKHVQVLIQSDYSHRIAFSAEGR